MEKYLSLYRTDAEKIINHTMMSPQDREELLRDVAQRLITEYRKELSGIGISEVHLGEKEGDVKDLVVAMQEINNELLKNKQ